MTIDKSNKDKIAFKTIVGKSHTHQNFNFEEEGSNSTIPLTVSTIFAGTIEKLPVTNGGLTVTGNTDNIVEKVRFEVEVVPDTEIGLNASQAYRLKLSTGYTGVLASQYSGNTGGTYLHETAGKLQIVPPLFGTMASDGSTEYDPVLFQTDGTTIIPKADNINWLLNPYDGIIFVQDPPNNYDGSSLRPAFLEAFLYVGSYLDKTLTGFTPSLIAGRGINPTSFALGDLDVDFSGYTAATNVNITVSGTNNMTLTTENDEGIKYPINYTGLTNLSLVHRQYVDERVVNNDSKDSVLVASTGDVDLTGGTFLGIMDSVSLNQDDRVLIKDNTTLRNNGIYTFVVSSSTFIRSVDFNGAFAAQISNGATTNVVSGTSNAGTSWMMITIDPITLETTDIVWTSLGDAINTAKNGLSVVGGDIELGGTLTGNTNVDTNGFSIDFGNGNTVTGANSFASGCLNTVTGASSHAEGRQTGAWGDYSHAEGYRSCALGDRSHAEGFRSCSVGTTSHAEGYISKSLGSFSHAEGYITIASGQSSHAEGRTTCAVGNYSHVEGRYSKAWGDYSHAEGKSCALAYVSHSEGSGKAIGVYSHAEGQGNRAAGCASHAEGSFNCAIGHWSHAEGYYTTATGVGSHAGGLGTAFSDRLFACGCAAFIHSHNTAAQTNGHGALANYSAILGGLNHNIEVGNTGATILGGSSAIKLTGTTYTGATAVDRLAIMSTPTLNAVSDQVLVRNSLGVIDYVSKSSITPTVANGLTINNGDIVLGGGLTGDTVIAGNGFGLAFGSHSLYACGTNSFAQGQCSFACGGNSFASGKRNCSIGEYSQAFGAYVRACGKGSLAMGDGSHTCLTGVYSLSSGCGNRTNGASSQAFGRYSCAWGNHSHAEGHRSYAGGNAAHSGGYSDNAVRKVTADGFSSFNHSRNTAAQTSGHGALADQSAILGGLNHNIETGNTNAVIVGGDTIKLTGTTYTGATAVDRLAIMSAPINNIVSDQILVRNSLGIIDYVSKGTFGLASGSSAANGLTNDGQNTVLGGTLTGNTTILASTFGLAFGIGAISSTGTSAVAFGDRTCAWGAYSFAQGRRTQAIGQSSHAGGEYSCAIGAQSHAEGYAVRTFGIRSHAEGWGSCATGDGSHAEGKYTKTYGDASHSQGCRTMACGESSHSGGKGLNTKFVCALGSTSFNHSYNNASQIAGHGALADQSAILGGRNHNIETGNTGATIMGGDGIKLTGTSYIDTTAIANLAIMSTPTLNAVSDQILVRNSLGIIDYVSKATISPTVANGLTNDGTNIVLGGTLTGDTCVNTGGFGIGFGLDVINTGAHSFAQGYCTRAYGDFSHAEGYYCVYAIGNFSHAEGCYTQACGIASHAEGYFTTATGHQSHSEGHDTFANGCRSHAEGFATHTATMASHSEGRNTCACGNYSHSEGRLTGAFGRASHSEGRCTRTGSAGVVGSGYYAHSEGVFTIASGACSHAEGSGTTTYTGFSHTEGKGTETWGLGSHAEGLNTCSIGNYSHAEGCVTCAIGLHSHAEGDRSVASGTSSHAEGYNTKANGSVSHAEGCITRAYGNASHAEGWCTYAAGFAAKSSGSATKAYGSNSYAGGYYTRACNYGSHASGYGRNTGNRFLWACGCVSFNHSKNDTSQIAGHGAIANYSAILGGLNHNIETGNIRAAIIGGNAIKLTGTTYIDHTAVDNLAIFSTPAASTISDATLVWDTADKKVKINTGLGSAINNVYDITGITGETLTSSEYVVLVQTSGASQTVFLPTGLTENQAYIIKDRGNALANNITIDGNGNNIDGNATVLIDTDSGGFEIVYSTEFTEWFILSFVN